jgi:hypothetical protein
MWPDSILGIYPANFPGDSAAVNSCSQWSKSVYKNGCKNTKQKLMGNRFHCLNNGMINATVLFAELG